MAIDSVNNNTNHNEDPASVTARTTLQQITRYSPESIILVSIQNHLLITRSFEILLNYIIFCI